MFEEQYSQRRKRLRENKLAAQNAIEKVKEQRKRDARKKVAITKGEQMTEDKRGNTTSLLEQFKNETQRGITKKLDSEVGRPDEVKSEMYIHSKSNP